MSLNEQPLLVEPTRAREAGDDLSPHERVEVADRLSGFMASALDFIDAFVPFDDGGEADPDTGLSRTQLLSLLIGFVGCDTNESLDSRTYTLVYTDGDSGKSNYQTICIPDYRAASPVMFSREGRNARLELRSTGEVLADVLVHSQIFGASSHYYSRVSPDFVELPTATIISPYTTCAGGCLGCSRGAVKSFAPPPKDYISRHVQLLANDFDGRGWDRSELVSVNITTGCQPDEERELEMMLQIIEEYRRHGFTNAAFFPFTYAIDSAAAMERLRDAGCFGFIGTVECFNDAERVRQWGRKKGSITFDQHVEKYLRARRVGFDVVETDYVLGADSYLEMLDGIRALDSAGVAVVPNIKRNYTLDQLNSNHDDIWDLGMTYIADGFHAAMATYRNGTIKRRAARYSVDFLNRQGWSGITLRDLPIRHT
ncbi:radical SAM protein [Saccharopolyspora griseoalba]|uniref:Radical SAM protein n=1 Tax=Saccharopolyspora griseoalba TaxID=1431848 RepID=A0ABW2LKN0_9PSEU